MKETKRTPVPLPAIKAKPKPKPKDAPVKAPLSQEFIESDDDSSPEHAQQPKKADKPKTTIGIHKSNGLVKPKSKISAKDTTTAKSAPKSTTTGKKPQSKQIVTEEQAADLSSSERSDDSDVPARDIQTKLPGNGERKDDLSESESESDDSSESSSDDSTENDSSRPVQKAAPPQVRASQPQVHAVEFQAAQPFVPPRGFQPVSLNDNATSTATNIFNNLQGKQVWHITAPAGVPLKDLKELAMAKVLDGDAVLSYKGADYGFSKTELNEDGTREVLVPQKNGYKAVSASISQTLHLQEVVRLPKLSSKQADQNTGSEAAASITRSTIRAPRPQVTGLKMRFLPTGFGGKDGGILGDSDGETESLQGTAGLGMPSELNLPSRKEKRKHADVNGSEAAASPSKKSKKHRTPEDKQRKEERRAKKEKKRAQEAAS